MPDRKKLNSNLLVYKRQITNVLRMSKKKLSYEVRKTSISVAY
jgi:hypothetical protein